MRNLIWKEFWQNSQSLLAIGITLVVPYVIIPMIYAIQSLQGLGYTLRGPDRAALFESAAVMGLTLSVVMAGFIGSILIAGERMDRSAEFAGYLPVPRGKSVASKAIVGLVYCLAAWILGSVIVIATRRLQPPGGTFGPHLSVDATPFVLWMYLGGIVLFFGIAWFYSALLRNPATAAAGVLGTGAVLAIAGKAIHSVLAPASAETFTTVSLCGLTPAIGLLFFAAGVIVCLRRVEP